MKTKIRLLTVVLALALALSLFLPAWAEGSYIDLPEDLTGQLVIIHTNDVHGRYANYAKIAALRKLAEERGGNVLLLDAGDALHGTPMMILSNGENAVTLMNAVGYDAMAPGNHDFNYGINRLFELDEMADFAILSANTFKDGEDKSALDAAVLFEFEDGMKVGVFGLTTPETAVKTSPKNVAGYNFSPDNLAEVAQDCIDSLIAQGAELIICIGHLGVNEESIPWMSTEVIAQVSGLDIFIDGHSHTEFAEGSTAKDADGNLVLLASSGKYIENLSVVIVNSDEMIAGYIDPSEIDADKDVAGIIAEMEAALKEMTDVIVTNIGDIFLDGRREFVRTGETNLGNLCTDAFVYVSGADVALTNGGGIRDSLPIDHTNPENDKYLEGAVKGDVTVGDLITVYPFSNMVVTIEVTGAELLAALNHGTAAYPGQSGGFPHVSGITFEIHAYKDADRVQNVKVNGEALDLEKTYLLATNDFIAEPPGGDGYTMLSKPILGYFGALEEALVKYVEEDLEGDVSGYADTEGRILVFNTPFVDVKAGDWFYDYVVSVYNEGLMVGTADNVFSPNGNVNRAMFVTILHRAFGKPEPNGAATDYFDDVVDGEWYSDAVAWAFEIKIVEGIGDRAFAPMNSLSREQLVTLIYRLAVKLDAVGEFDKELTFTDADKISSWAADAVAYAVAEGIVNGMPDGSFDPSGITTRAQVAKVITEFIELPEIAEAIEKYLAGEIDLGNGDVDEPDDEDVEDVEDDEDDEDDEDIAA